MFTISEKSVLKEARAFRPFKSGEEYLEAMKEDIAEWLQKMYPWLEIHNDNFFEKLWTGVALCQHANAVKEKAIEYVQRKQAKIIMSRSITGSVQQAENIISIPEVKYFPNARAGTFFARDNVSNFILWCRKSLGIIECLLFETDDLIMQKNEKHVILCLLEVARQGVKFGMEVPMLIQMERQIDREIAADQKMLNEKAEEEEHHDAEDEESDLDDNESPILHYGPVPQIVTNDLKSLDEMVRDLVAQCTCPTQFPMIRVAEGKYKIGDTRVLIFVRILRNHVMVRVGGGWDTLSHYLDKHDPCRCRSQHRSLQGARLINRPGAADLHGSHVHYDRAPAPLPASLGGATLGPPMNAFNRSRSRSPSSQTSTNYLRPNDRRSLSPTMRRRSRSPTPYFTSSVEAKIAPSSAVARKAQQSVHHLATLPVVKMAEATLQINDNLTDNSDTISEVSDEGYRSLGLVHEKKKVDELGLCNNGGEDAADHVEQPSQLDETNEIGLRKTNFSTIYSPPSKPSPKSTRANSLDRPRPIQSSPKSSPKAHHANVGTWGGRGKQTRHSLTDHTFSPNLSPRNSLGRRSISSLERKNSKTTITSSGGSQGNSPTKRNSFKDDVLNALDSGNPKLVEEIRHLLATYKMKNDEMDDGVGFRRDSTRASLRSPRKDSRLDTQYSRIPAPVSHKT